MKNLFSMKKTIARFSVMAVIQIACYHPALLAKQYDACTDAFEPNNERRLASPIETNREYQAMINSALDIDWFQFSVSDQELNVQVLLYNLPANYDIYLYN